MSGLISIAEVRAAQSSLFPQGRTVALAPEVEAMLASGAALAIGVSGGKDRAAYTLAVSKHLDNVVK